MLCPAVSAASAARSYSPAVTPHSRHQSSQRRIRPRVRLKSFRSTPWATNLGPQCLVATATRSSTTSVSLVLLPMSLDNRLLDHSRRRVRAVSNYLQPDADHPERACRPVGCASVDRLANRQRRSPPEGLGRDQGEGQGPSQEDRLSPRRDGARVEIAPELCAWRAGARCVEPALCSDL